MLSGDQDVPRSRQDIEKRGKLVGRLLRNDGVSELLSRKLLSEEKFNASKFCSWIFVLD